MRREMQELDAISLKLDNEKIWPLLDEITMEGLRQSERLNHEIQQLENKPEHFLNWLLKSLERLKIINNFRKEVLNFFSDTVNQTHDFMQKEEVLLKKLQKNDDMKAAPTLLQFYSEHGEINLLEKLLESLNPQTDEALIHLYNGVIAAHRCLFETMEANFTKALKLSPSLEKTTRQIRITMAQIHNNYYPLITIKSLTFSIKTMLKAFRYNSSLPEVSEKIFLIENPNLLQLVTPEKAFVIHSFYARYLMSKENFREAASALQAATNLTPDNPELYLLLADIFFATGDFPKAITALDRAVALDRSLGVEWEHIGDSLMASGQAEDAVAVYEKSFLALPENLHLLKKIGDVYLAMDQPEAAREAYRLLHEKLSPAGVQNES
jgi:tetratricopeptide (TPR) repeat protein